MLEFLRATQVIATVAVAKMIAPRVHGFHRL
jgi:hypothetical protein